MRFSTEVVSALKGRLLRAKANGFRFTDAEAADAARETKLTVEQVKHWVLNTHTYYRPYEDEKMSHMDKIEAFLTSAKVSYSIIFIYPSDANSHPG